MCRRWVAEIQGGRFTGQTIQQKNFLHFLSTFITQSTLPLSIISQKNWAAFGVFLQKNHKSFFFVAILDGDSVYRRAQL